jgi:nucleotide-binding universal stress UspA family protein
MKRFPPEAILVPTDLSETSLAALSYARALRERFGSRVTVLHAEHLEAPPYFTSTQAEALLEASRGARAQAVQQVRRVAESRLGFAPEVEVVDGVPSEAVAAYCEEWSPDLVVLGTHGRRGVSRLWLGSVTERVIRTSRCPVLAVRRPAAPEGFGDIFCPVTSGSASEAALAYAVAIAESQGSNLHVLHVAERGEAPLKCPGVSDDLRDRCQIEETLAQGRVVEGILEGVRDAGSGLIVMGSERKTTPLGELFSSTTAQVVQRLDIPVIVVPASDLPKE